VTLTISVPVWGSPAYMQIFTHAAAPALKRSLENLRMPARFLIHTDQPDAARAALAGCEVEVRQVPNKSTYVALQESHADAVRRARVGDRVVLLNADLVVSNNFLARCMQHLDAGKDAVVLLGIRTTAGPDVPAGMRPRELLAWAWAHRHQIIRDLEWPRGGSMIPTNLFFSGSGGSVVARGFHLHPAAIIKRADTKFSSTIDGDLLDCIPRSRIHVVVDPDDCAMLEVSAPERRFPVRGGLLTPGQVAASMRTRASPTHCWLFRHRITVCGSPAQVSDDLVACDQILRLLRAAAPDDAPAGEIVAPREPRAPRGAAPAGRRLHPYRREQERKRR